MLENKEFYKMIFDGSYYDASRPGSDIDQLRQPRANSFHFVNEYCNSVDINNRLPNKKT